MVVPTTPFPRSANESHALSCWEYRPNLTLRHDPTVYEAAVHKNLLPCSLPNEASRPLTGSRLRGSLNRPVRKRAYRRKVGMSLTTGTSSTGF